MPGTIKGHLLIDRYPEIVDSLYYEPTDEIVMGSYLEKGIQFQPQPKKRKIDKKTVQKTSRSGDIRTIFANITNRNNHTAMMELSDSASTLDISNFQGDRKCVRDNESSNYRKRD